MSPYSKYLSNKSPESSSTVYLSVAERQKTCNDGTLVAKQAGEKAKRKIETVQKLFLYQEQKKKKRKWNPVYKGKSCLNQVCSKFW